MIKGQSRTKGKLQAIGDKQATCKKRDRKDKKWEEEPKMGH